MLNIYLFFYFVKLFKYYYMFCNACLDTLFCVFNDVCLIYFNSYRDYKQIKKEILRIILFKYLIF